MQENLITTIDRINNKIFAINGKTGDSPQTSQPILCTKDNLPFVSGTGSSWTEYM